MRIFEGGNFEMLAHLFEKYTKEFGASHGRFLTKIGQKFWAKPSAATACAKKERRRKNNWVQTMVENERNLEMGHKYFNEEKFFRVAEWYGITH